jgi:hypothetical protein
VYYGAVFEIKKAIPNYTLVYLSHSVICAEGKPMLLKTSALLVLAFPVGIWAQNVVTNPTASQNIVQPVNTSFSANNYAGVRYLTNSYNWSQSPSSPASLSAGVPATVTLTPCPIGIDTSNNVNAPYSVYVAGTGTAEPALVSSGSCTTGAASGTIVFTPANTHAAGYTVSSASSGLQEALNDAGSNAKVVIPPNGADANALPIQARVTVHGSKVEIDGYGAHLKCFTRDTCLFLGSPATSTTFSNVRVKGITFESATNIAGVQMSSMSRSGTTVTAITAASHPFVVGDWVQLQLNALFNGMFKVLSVPNSTTFTFNTQGSGTVASFNTFGFAALENAAIEDNAEGSLIDDVQNFITGSFRFHSLIVVDNDQHAKIRGLEISSTGVRCDSNGFCGSVIYGPGGSGGNNSGIIYVEHSEISLQCAGNGIDNLNGNSMAVTDSVIQGFAQFGVRNVKTSGLANNLNFINVYQEVGNCSNNLGTLGQAGVINAGETHIMGGVGPTGSGPRFTNTGATQYNYYIVIHDSVKGTSTPLFAGFALTNGTGNITVNWPIVYGTGTITYDIIRNSGLTAAPYTAACTGGSATACGSIALARPQCSSLVCAFTDNAASSTSSYTVANPAYYPALAFWNGSVVLTPVADTLNDTSLPGFIYIDDARKLFGGQQSKVNSVVGNLAISLFSHVCGNSIVGVGFSCLQGNMVGNNNTPNVATLLYRGGATGGADNPSGLKGRLNFITSPSTSIGQTHLVTLVDSAPDKTIASSDFRPSNNASDTYIGLDSGSVNFSSAQLAFGSPVSISNYVANVGDGSNWLERLTASTKTFKVPITTNSQITSTLSTGTAPFVVASTTPVANLTLSNHPKLQSCGTTGTCSDTAITGGQVVFGTITLATGTATLTGINPAFSSSASFNCVANDRTNQANGVKGIPTSGSTVIFTGTGTDVIAYQCVGN